jgi:UDP-3-O-[3-hydroxymyristoyl] glucosamine N-acyltransferase
MKFDQPILLTELAAELGVEVIGDASGHMVLGMNEIHKVEPGDLTFVDVAKYYQKSLRSAATYILINDRVPYPEGKVLLYTDTPFQLYNNLAMKMRPPLPVAEGISPSACIHPSARIEPGVHIGHHVVIGADCHIQMGAFIGDYCVLGDRVRIQTGAIIGTDAFYYKRTPEGFIKWHSIGRVCIENDVEVGAGCTINRGVSGDTILGEGSKLDCQIHIGHGVVLGKRCLLAGQVGIGGKTIVGDEVVLYGQVGVAQSLRIGKGAIVLAKSGVSKSLEGGKVYFGTPAAEMSIRYRELAALRQLPEFLQKNS